MLFPPFQKTAPKPKNGSEIKYQSIILDEEKLLKLENFCSSQREKKTSSHKILRSENQTSEVVFLEKISALRHCKETTKKSFNENKILKESSVSM